MKLFLIFFFCFLSALSFAAQEEISFPLKEEHLFNKPIPKIESLTAKKIIGFGSLSIASGVGVSYRTRDCARGRALDFKMGYVKPGFFSNPDKLYWPMLDYNFIHYRSGSNGNAPYLSWGIGAAVLNGKKSLPFPYIPLRAGFEFEYGFVDLGAKLLFGMLPIPEARFGVGVSF